MDSAAALDQQFPDSAGAEVVEDVPEAGRIPGVDDGGDVLERVSRSRRRVDDLFGVPDGEELRAKPAAVLPLAQRYFLF